MALILHAVLPAHCQKLAQEKAVMERRKATLPAFMVLSCIVLSSQFVARSADAHVVYLTYESYSFTNFIQAFGRGEDGQLIGDSTDGFSYFPVAENLEYSRTIRAGESFASESFSYHSSTQSSGDSFVYSVTGQGTATVSTSLDSLFSAATLNWSHLQLEFLVTEEVLYQGGFLLADVPTQVRGPYPEGANFFGSGSILGPGTYSFFAGSASPGGLFAGTGYVGASPGQTLSSSFYMSNTLRFTAVPTPSSLLLLSTAVALSLLARRKRKHQLAHVHA